MRGSASRRAGTSTSTGRPCGSGGTPWAGRATADRRASQRYGHIAVVRALADDLAAAIATARVELEEIDRRSDVTWHAEMVLSVAIAKLRAGQAALALTYLEVLRLQRIP